MPMQSREATVAHMGRCRRHESANAVAQPGEEGPGRYQAHRWKPVTQKTIGTVKAQLTFFPPSLAMCYIGESSPQTKSGDGICSPSRPYVPTRELSWGADFPHKKPFGGALKQGLESAAIYQMLRSAYSTIIDSEA